MVSITEMVNGFQNRFRNLSRFILITIHLLLSQISIMICTSSPQDLNKFVGLVIFLTIIFHRDVKLS